ncbi:hypothetical protein GA0115280_110243 [Streptomyces sp. Cmuel-A718b]|nr:hypothetical protein GA0115280_110243 [Streptomyces sp. Cmuel-A718b]
MRGRPGPGRPSAAPSPSSVLCPCGAAWPAPAGAAVGAVRGIGGAARAAATAVSYVPISSRTPSGQGKAPRAGACGTPGLSGRDEVSSARISSAVVGLRAGSRCRQSATVCRSSSGTRERSGRPWAMRCTIAASSVSSNGPWPVAAKQSTVPRQNTSDAPVTDRSPATCSGDMKPGDPTMTPVAVSAVASYAWAIPKSISRGPVAPRTTLAGFRSRWTSRAPCTAASPRAMAAPRSRTTGTGSGPCRPTASSSDGPAMYWVASHGRSASGSASTSAETYGPRTARAASASRRKRSRKSPACSRSRRTVFSATRPSGPPPGGTARWTVPIPPEPSPASSR